MNFSDFEMQNGRNQSCQIDFGSRPSFLISGWKASSKSCSLLKIAAVIFIERKGHLASVEVLVALPSLAHVPLIIIIFYEFSSLLIHKKIKGTRYQRPVSLD